MAARQPSGLSATHFGDYVRLRWSDNTALPGDAPEGYLLYVDDTAVTVPTWTTPPAIDNELNGGDGETPVQNYEMVIHYPTGTACDWETFEEYQLGINNSLSLGGPKWIGGFRTGPASAFKGYGDDFESYPIGAITGPLASGSGFSNIWRIGDL